MLAAVQMHNTQMQCAHLPAQQGLWRLQQRHDQQLMPRLVA